MRFLCGDDERRTSSQAGITLIEVTVTLFIIGLATGAILLNLPKSPAPLVRAEMQITEFMKRAFEQAQFSGETLSIVLDDDRLIVREKRGEDWYPLESEPLPNPVTGIQVHKFQAVRTINRVSRVNRARQTYIEDLKIFPIGFMESGIWQLNHFGQIVELYVSVDGQIVNEENDSEDIF